MSLYLLRLYVLHNIYMPQYSLRYSFSMYVCMYVYVCVFEYVYVYM